MAPAAAVVDEEGGMRGCCASCMWREKQLQQQVRAARADAKADGAGEGEQATLLRALGRDCMLTHLCCFCSAAVLPLLLCGSIAGGANVSAASPSEASGGVSDTSLMAYPKSQ